MNDAQHILEEMDSFDFGVSEQISPDARRQRRWRMLNPERNRRIKKEKGFRDFVTRKDFGDKWKKANYPS